MKHHNEMNTLNTMLLILALVCVSNGEPLTLKTEINKMFLDASSRSPVSINSDLNVVDQQFDKFVTFVSKGLGVSSIFLGSVPGLVSAIIDMTQSYNSVTQPENNAKFFNSMVSVADGQILIQKISDIRALLLTVDGNIERMTSGNHTLEEKRPEVSTGYAKLELIHQYYKEKNSVLRKYPLHSTPLLLALTRLFQAFIPLGIKINSIIKNSSEKLLCGHQELLEDYRALSIAARFKLLDLEWKTGKHDLHPYPRWEPFEEYIILNEDYNPNGYGLPSDTNIRCYRSPSNCSEVPGKGVALPCIKDHLSSEWYEEPKSESNCFQDYLKNIRELYGKEFDKYITKLSTSCTPKSGEMGKAEIVVERAQVSNSWNDWSDGAEVYVTVKVDAISLGSTPTNRDGTHRIWRQSFFTSDNIPKNSVVKFEIWEEDFWNSDDFIGSTNIRITDVLNGSPTFGFANKSISFQGESLLFAIKWMPN